MGLKEKLINRLKKHNGQRFEIILETSEGFSSYSIIECADVYVKEEIMKLGEDADYFANDVINIVDKDTMISFALMDEGIKSIKDNVNYSNDLEWIDKFDIEYESGTTIDIDVFSNDYEKEVIKNENVLKDKEVSIISYNKDGYIKDLLSRRYFPKNNKTLIEVLTTLKSLEGKDLLINNAADIVASKYIIGEMELEEFIGEAMITDGIQIRESFSDAGVFIGEDRIKNFTPLDVDLLDEESEIGYEIKFDDGSFLTIEVLKGN